MAVEESGSDPIRVPPQIEESEAIQQTEDWFYFDPSEELEGDYRRDMRYLVAYDIGENRRRTKLARILEEYGDRVQKSVFECLLNETSYRELWDRLAELVEDPEDRLRVYPLCKACEGKVEVAGGGPKRLEVVEVYIV